MQPFVDIFRRHYTPLLPEPTDGQPRLQALCDVRAVLFDLYGTLFVSGCGEVGTTRQAASQAALFAAAEAMGLDVGPTIHGAAERMQARIQAVHAEITRRHGIDFPEIQVAEIWADVFAELARQGVLPESVDPAAIDYEHLAVEYEARANPCWPMPHMAECLQSLRDRGTLLGIISNAQFYTPLLFPALVGQTVAQCGFDAALQFYSYQHGFAKPGLPLFALAARELARRNIAPKHVLYVGNDMLNDIAPAARLGFQTALFVGDARSLRLRENDPRIAGVTATIVIADLAQLAECTKI
ncbi:MAG: HAD family hydrolase [Patescibacteria group bacterium]|nr:HAD family hydrolase [Patescibacteria group bacterium]